MKDYYDVLRVSTSATEDEIKSAYRKTALRCHPDRNYGNVEEATREFAEAQTAYEVLSDANERAWYDRHKDSILRGDNTGGGSYEDEDVVGLSAEQLMAYFSVVSSAPLNDSAKGFFTILRQLFDTIIGEELEACKQQDIDAPSLPTFGGSHSDDYSVRDFYSFWSNFSSNKTFSWAEQYAYHRAPDRRVRRAMEKENAKSRQVQKKEYVETIHKLISYMKKRDFRFIAKPQVSAAQRQQELLAARNAQVEASRAANNENLQKYTEQDWQKVDDRQLAEEEMQAFEEWNTEIECVACGKTFKSEKQFASHEKSKKHVQTVKRLRWELKKEALAMGLDYESDDAFTTADEGENESSTGAANAVKTSLIQHSPLEDSAETLEPTETVSSGQASVPSTKPPSVISNDEYGSEADFEARLEIELDELKLEVSQEEPPTLMKPTKPVKKNKRKAATMKKKKRG